MDGTGIEWHPPIDKSQLKLSNLTVFDFDPEKIDAHLAKCRAERQAMKEKYGDKWRDEMYKQDRERAESAERQIINDDIYHVGKLRPFGPSYYREHLTDMFERRCRELYGERYDELMANPVIMNPIVADLLIQDAIKTGRWQELPDCLYDEYHKRKCDM